MGTFALNRVTNANVLLNGTSLLGQVEEITVGPVKYIEAEHKALGMIGKMEFFSGIDKIELKMKWNSFYSSSLIAIGNPMQWINLQVRSNVDAYNSGGLTAQNPLVIYCVVASKDFPFGMFKQHENVELETNFAVMYIKIEENGVALFEFDATANIFRVNGIDIAAQYRANLGI